MKVIKMCFSPDGERQEEYIYVVKGVFKKRIYMLCDQVYMVEVTVKS